MLDYRDEAALGRLIDISSHSHYSGLETSSLTEEDKTAIKNLFNFIVEKFNFNLPAQEQQDGK